MRNFTQTLSTRANENLTSFNPLTNSIFTKAVLLTVFSLATSFQLIAGTFTANQNGQWTTAATWTITNPTPGASNTIPGAADDVIIPAGYLIDINASQTCNTLKLNGALSGNGNRKVTVLGDVEYAGSTNCLLVQPTSNFKIKAGASIPNMTLGNVIIDLPPGGEITTTAITQTAIHQVNSPLILGFLKVQSGNLKITEAFNIVGMSVSIEGSNSSITFGGIQDIIRTNNATNFIAISQGGLLILENIGKGQSPKRQFDVLFPVGTLNGTYTPVTINNKDFNPASINGKFAVTVSNGVYMLGTDGALVTNNVVNKTWLVSLLSGNSNATITFQWNQPDELSDFTPTNSKIAEYSNNSWTLLNTGTTFDPVARTITRVGLIGNGGPVASPTPISFPLITVQGGQINPLPVELVSFNAVKKNKEVALTWETASEKNNKGYEIQSSADGKNYEALGFVASQNGNSNSAQRYAFTHKTGDQEGLIYYRLKQIDLDGTVAFYNAKVVDLGRFTATAQAYPNPFREQFRIELETTLNGPADVVITDMTGKTVYQAQHALQKGMNNIMVALKNQPAGFYFLKAVSGNQTYTNRLMKQ